MRATTFTTSIAQQDEALPAWSGKLHDADPGPYDANLDDSNHQDDSRVNREEDSRTPEIAQMYAQQRSNSEHRHDAREENVPQP
jgi:hypothetical protein